jgi:hypothetical protein
MSLSAHCRKRRMNACGAVLNSEKALKISNGANAKTASSVSWH